MSNIYLKTTIKKSWHSHSFNFLSLKNLSSGQFWGSSNSRRYCWIFKLLVATKKTEVWEQNRVLFFCYFKFERNCDVLKWKSPCILLNQNINFDKNETEWRIENSTRSFRETNLVLQLNCEVNCSSRERKKRGHFLYRSFCLKKIFVTCMFYLSVQCIEFTFRIDILLHLKRHYFIHFLLVFKIVESLQCILKKVYYLF